MQNKKYGEYGGQYVAESLMNVLKELESAYNEAINDPEFIKEYHYYLKEYVGRETPLYFAQKLSKKYGTKIYLKREDLNHTGAHKINNVIGQILLAKRMGKKKVIAETGAGQHGVATATGAALFDMECTVFMGEEDMERQALNVFRMEMLGTKVECVKSGSRTLKDATNEAIRTWAKNAEDTFYIIGSAVGPHPYPQMVKEFQRVISVETKKQILEKEGNKILAKINEREFVIALAIEGKQFPSEKFSQLMMDTTVHGFSDITFVIGGSLGLSPAVKKRANLLMSFGKLTLPHQLMRLVLVEQIYRAFMIQQGSPYHK